MKEKYQNNNLKKYLHIKFLLKKMNNLNNYYIQFLIVYYNNKGFKIESIGSDEKVEL